MILAGGGAGEELVGIVEAGRAAQGVGALHLTVDRARDGEIAVRVVHGIAPGFLAEDALVLNHHGVEHAVGVEVGVEQKLLLAQARHGIGGHEVVSGRVHVGVIGLIAQIEEQSFGRILVRAVKGGMLKDMRKTRVVRGPGEERQIKHTVGIFIGDIHQSGTGLLMFKENSGSTDKRKIPDFLHFKSFHHFTHSRYPTGGCCRQSVCKCGKGSEQHDHDDGQGKQLFHWKTPP